MGKFDNAAWSAASSLELFPLREATTVVGLAASLPAVRWLFDECLFKPIARWSLVPTALRKPGQRLPDKLQSRITKMTESLWKLLCYSTFAVVGLCATYNQPWLYDTRQLWTDWPNQVITPAMRLMYAGELAYYLATIIMLALWEVPRKDSHVMMTHHVVTVVLLTFSYKYNYTRGGCVVMLLHDLNDVLMEIAKCFNYVKMETASTVLFAAFVASWAVLRIYIFPFHIIKSTLLEVTEILGYQPPQYKLLNALMVGLYCIHLYWFALILRIVWVKLTTGQTYDIREGDSDDEDD